MRSLKHLSQSSLCWIVAVVFMLSAIGVSWNSIYASEQGDQLAVSMNVVGPFAYVVTHLSDYPVWQAIIQCVMLLLNTFLVQTIVRRYELIRTISILPSFFYAFSVAVSVPVHFLLPASVAMCLLLLAVINLFNCYREEHCRVQIFNACFFLTLAALLVPPILLLIPFYWLTFHLLNRMSIGRFLISLAGVGFVFWLLGGILFVSGQWHLFGIYFQAFASSFGWLGFFDWTEGVFYAAMSLIFLLSVGNWIGSDQHGKLSIRMYLMTSIGFWVLSMLLSFLCPDWRYTFLLFSIAPFSVLLGHYYSTVDDFFSRIMWILYMIVSLGYFLSFLV